MPPCAAAAASAAASPLGLMTGLSSLTMYSQVPVTRAAQVPQCPFQFASGQGGGGGECVRVHRYTMSKPSGGV